MTDPKRDIESRADIEKLVRTFYAAVTKDPEIGHFFEKVDFEHHFPRMFDFWAFVLLDEAGFKGNVFDRHVGLGIGSKHFPMWLKHFNATVDGLFAGEKAELAKQRAASVAYTFDAKLKKM